MQPRVPRVALFADTFHEVNGAANVLRRLVDFARKHHFPLACIRAGEKTNSWQDGSVQVMEFARGRLSVAVDCELRYDPMFWLNTRLLRNRLKEFRPDVIHVTGGNDVSQLGFLL